MKKEFKDIILEVSILVGAIIFCFICVSVLFFHE